MGRAVKDYFHELVTMDLKHSLEEASGLKTEGMPLISVVICTHNRANYLLKAMQSVLDQSMPANRYEVIVVDNGSTDETRELVERFEDLGNVHYIFEGKLGLCHARNTGWRNARGRYIAYLDDDAIASPEWLMAIEEAFTMAPDAGVVGGRVVPIWEGDRPAWLSDDIALSLTIVNWHSAPRLIPDVQVEWLVGANMAVPASVLAETDGFHPWLDRVGRHMLSSGDVFLQKEIIRRGYSCLYHPGIAVSHLVPRSRLNKRWFIRRYYSQGLSDAIIQIIEEAPSRKRRLLLAIAKTLDLLYSPKKVMNLLLPKRDPRLFAEQCFTLITLGHIMGLLGALGK